MFEGEVSLKDCAMAYAPSMRSAWMSMPLIVIRLLEGEVLLEESWI